MDGTTEYALYRSDELAGEAWAAMSRQDIDEALRLWQALREHSPERHEGHIWPIQVLWQCGRHAEAEAMAARSLSSFPDHPELLVQRAWIVTAQRNWDEAATRWATVRERAPERIEGYVWGARSLWQSGAFDEAEKVAREGVRRFPRDLQALSESGWVATARQDWPEALRRWRRAHEAHPEQVVAQTRMIEALRMAGRADEAEALATARLAEHPDEPELLIEHVWAAVAREDWQAAAVRLDAVQANEKAAPLISEPLAAVEPQIRSLSAAATSPAASIDEEIPVNELVLKFESIGERCDFGAVQRHFGAEPLGLLRFAWSRLDCLIAALADRFEAIGTVDDTGFEAYGDETILRMKKYALIFHTFVNGVDQQPADQREVFYQQQRRRLLFLKDKLVRDLEAGEKIWIYATRDYATDADAAKLSAALRAYGPNALLYVRPERDDRPAGTVEALGDGLYAGYFPDLTDFVSGHQPPFGLWRELCLRTYQLVQRDAAVVGKSG